MPDDLVSADVRDKGRKAALEGMLRAQRQIPDNPRYEQLRVPYCFEYPENEDECQPSSLSLRDVAHFLLDICGFGYEACDGANAAMYYEEGDHVNAAFSTAALVPVLGWGPTLRKWLGKACSFTGDTHVLMADGTTKPIKDIKVGDQVWATDPETGEKGARTVTAVWKHLDTVLDLVTHDGATVTTTEDHPYWNATDHQWQQAQHLDPGDHLLAANGHLIKVVGLRLPTARTATAYNITIHEIHTYHVLAEQTPVLVHNCGGGFVAPKTYFNRHGELTNGTYTVSSEAMAKHLPITAGSGKSVFLWGVDAEKQSWMRPPMLMRMDSG